MQELKKYSKILKNYFKNCKRKQKKSFNIACFDLYDVQQLHIDLYLKISALFHFDTNLSNSESATLQVPACCLIRSVMLFIAQQGFREIPIGFNSGLPAGYTMVLTFTPST